MSGREEIATMLSGLSLPIEAIFFDYGGTLDAPGIAWKERFYPLYQKHGVCVDISTFTRAFYHADDSLVEENPSSLNLTQIVHEQVSRVLHYLERYDPKIKAKIADEFVSDSLRNIRNNLTVLRELKKRYKLGIISNNYGNLKAICDETGLSEVMDVLVDSNIVGYEKPDTRIFLEALKCVDIEPSKAIMVGDNVKRDIHGALNVGMQPILISSGNLPADVTVPDVPEIESLNELQFFSK